MTVTSRYLLASLTLITAVIGAASVHADPLPLRDKVKFNQQPMNQTPIQGALYWGHDELSTAYAPIGPAPNLYRGQFMADDFADTLNTPVVHVKFWGSYLNNTDQFGHI